MPRNILLILLLPVLADTLLAEGYRGAQATAVVATWNLAGFTAIPRERAPIFARAIADLDPAIVGLAEVNENWLAAEVIAELLDHGLCYRRTIVEQSVRQNLAILSKCEVEIGNARLVPGSDDGNPRLRSALATDVRIGQFDFVLIVVHLKAGRDPDDAAVRARQARALGEFIEAATSANEKDVLLIGDYNMVPGEDDFTSFGPFLRVVSSAELEGSFSHISRSGTPGRLLDGFAISDDHTVEYIDGSLRVFPLHQALGLSLADYRDTVSDHLPVVGHFRILSDDD